MPTTPQLPPHGTPMQPTGQNSMREVFGDIARQAGRPVDIHGAVGSMVGPNGMDVSIPAYPQIVLFQITNAEFGSSSSSGTPPRIWRIDALTASYYPQNLAWTKGRRVYWGVSQYDPCVLANDTEEELLFHAVGYQQGQTTTANTPIEKGLRDGPAFLPKLSSGDKVWCIWDEDMGGWQILQPCEDILRVKLTQDLPQGGQATAQLVIARGPNSSGLSQGFDLTVTLLVHDVLWNGAMYLDGSSSSSSASPALTSGTYVYVKYFADSQWWEVMEAANRRVLIGKLTSILSAGGSATVAVYAGDPGSEAATGESITAYDRLLKPGQSAPSGKWCVVTWINGHPYFTNIACP